MRRACIFFALLACVALLALCPPAPARAEGRAQETNTAELLERWEEFDGREVILEGEVVGDVMRRGDHAWITVNDDVYSREARLESGKLRGGNSGIGVWLPAEEAEKIVTLGRYGTVGDLVRVRGTFHADCSQHGGDFDIHAVSLEVVDSGRRLDTSPGGNKYLAALFSFLFLMATLIPFMRRRAREMRKARKLLREED